MIASSKKCKYKVYALKMKDGIVIRGGYTKRPLEERIKEYRSKHYYDQIDYIKYMCAETKEDAKNLEGLLLDKYCPPCNIMGVEACKKKLTPEENLRREKLKKSCGCN